MNKLLNLIRPVITDDLIRIGRNSDGGYVINKSSVQRVKLISLGVSDDWSFEENFLKISNERVIMYDGTVSTRIFLYKFLRSILDVFSVSFFLRLILRPKQIINHLRSIKHHYFIYRGFKSFTSLSKVNFISEFVSDLPNTTRLDRIIKNNVKEQEKIFLKIDIESHEYRIIDDILINQEYISGMVIEFHDIDIMFNKFEEIICRLKEYFYITHIHANNFSHFNENIGTLAIYEISFINKELLSTNPTYFKGGIYHLPGLDFRNNLSLEDYIINFDIG